MTTAKSIMATALKSAARAIRPKPAILVITLPSRKQVAVQINVNGAASTAVTLDAKELARFIEALQRQLEGLKQ